MLRALRQCYIPVRARDALPSQHLKRLYGSSTVSSIRSSANLSGKVIGLHNFKDCTSQFNGVEEKGLRIRIIDKESFSDATGIDETTKPLPSSATDLYLDEIGPKQIRLFDAKYYPGKNKVVCSFLGKLNNVVMNNDRPKTVPRVEKYVDNMAVELMKSVECDDGIDLTMAACNLRLSMGERTFTAKAAKEARRGKGIIWAIQVNKHVENTGYKKGDIPVAACMIAAYQKNAAPMAEVYPERMMGIKIRGEELHFYSMKMTASYLEDLEEGTPNEDIEVLKYPCKKGLNICVPEERRQILNHLWSMRCYAEGLKWTANNLA